MLENTLKQYGKGLVSNQCSFRLRRTSPGSIRWKICALVGRIDMDGIARNRTSLSVISVTIVRVVLEEAFASARVEQAALTQISRGECAFNGSLQYYITNFNEALSLVCSFHFPIKELNLSIAILMKLESQ